MKYFKFIILFILLQLGCKKEKQTIPEKDYWKPVEDLTYEDKNASYCNSDGELLFIRSLSTFSLFNNNHVLKQKYFYGQNPQYGYSIFPMVNGIFVNISNNPKPFWLSISIVNPYQSFGNFEINRVDTNILSIDNRNIRELEPACLGSPSGYYLFKIIDRLNSNASLLIFNIYGPNYLKKVLLSIPFFELTFHFYEGGKFYFSDNYGKSLYTMDSTGNYEKIANKSFNRITNVNGIMFGINYEWQLKLSFDKGYTWQSTSVRMNTMQLINVNGKAIYFKNNSIAELKIDGNTIQGIEYNSKGLEGNQITWICKHNDRYYCTTKSGVFYIEEKYFVPN